MCEIKIYILTVSLFFFWIYDCDVLLQVLNVCLDVNSFHVHENCARGICKNAICFFGVFSMCLVEMLFEVPMHAHLYV